MRITHVLADGTVLESIEGHVVKSEDNPEVYERLIAIVEEKEKKLND